MTNNERDIFQLYQSLKTLSGYLEMSKAGRLEFALDIPTQIFKIFFDRSSRNNNTTLFERVCGDKVITFHPIRRALLIAKVNGSTLMSYHTYLDYLDIDNHNEIHSDESEIQFDLFALNATPIPFEAWKMQILQVTNLIEVPESNVRNTVTATSLEEMLLKNVPSMISLLEKIAEVTQRYYLSTPSADNPRDLMMMQWQEITQHSNIIELTIEGFFRIIRHKDSAHADPMDNPKWQKEYDEFNAANASSNYVGDTEITYEELVIIIADYLVKRVNEQLFSEKN